MKYCVNCKHHTLVHPPVHGVGDTEHFCIAPLDVRNLVTGELLLVNTSCKRARELRGALCGPKAKLFASPDELAVEGTSDGVSYL